MGSSISIHEIINFVVPDRITFVSIPASVDDAVVASSSGTKTLLANGQSRFFINHNPAFYNGQRMLLGNPPVWTILEILILGNLPHCLNH